MIGAQVVVRERVPDAVAALDLDGRVALAAESALAARDVLDAGGADRRDLTRVEVLPEVLAEVRHVFPTALLTIRYFSKTRFYARSCRGPQARLRYAWTVASVDDRAQRAGCITCP